MPIGLPVALALLAPEATTTATATVPVSQSSTTAARQPVYGPVQKLPAAKPAPPPVAKPAERECVPPAMDPNSAVILVCGQRPQGYRLNPDVTEAKRELHGGGKLNPPNMMRDNRCAIGPQGCVSAGINLIAAALTAAEMAKRLAEGKEIGSMFITDPHPDEYHLYLAAKARREAREAEAAALAVKAKAQAKAAQAKAAAPPAEPVPASTPAPQPKAQ